MELIKAKHKYTRTEVKSEKDKLFIFTDNCNRTSGGHKISNESEYSKRFGKTGLCYPSMTSAVLRGVKNAYPITTQKYYNNSSDYTKNRWTDDDFEEFKKIIDDDIEHIKSACIKNGYKTIVFPQYGILNSKISAITLERTPKLFSYIINKEIELKEFKI